MFRRKTPIGGVRRFLRAVSGFAVRSSPFLTKKENRMNKQDYTALFNALHPRFFEREDILDLPEGEAFEEMLLPLGSFDPRVYDKKLVPDVSFGFYSGDTDELKSCAERVISGWSAFFGGDSRVYCGFVGGSIASFCIVEDMGTPCVNGRPLKVGGPGCVGTLPEYRNRGIGLIMVRNVTQLLKDEGFDYSYIHYTAVAGWYEKLGYRTILKWTGGGFAG